MWSAGHRWPVFGAWFVLTIGLFVASLAAGGTKTIDVNEDPSGPRLEAQEAYDILGAGEPVAPSERIVIVIDGGAGATTDPAFRAAVADLVTDLGAAHASVDGTDTPTFDELVDPFTAPAAGRPRLGRRDDGPGRRQRPGRGSAGRAPARPGRGDRRRRPGGDAGRDDPRRQRHVHQPRHQRPHHPRPRQLAPDHPAADLRDPAARLRGDRGQPRPAGPRRDLAPRGVRVRRPLQPVRLRGQRQRDPADRAHRPRGRGRLLALHGHAVPDGATPRALGPAGHRDRRAARPAEPCSSRASR